MTDTGVHSFEEKRMIEKHIHETTSLKNRTILRPCGFFETLLWDVMRKFMTTWRADVPIKLIGADDIGRIAAQCFERPDEFAGQTLEIAGDQLLPAQFSAVWEEVTGEKLVLEDPSIVPSFFKEMIVTMDKLSEQYGHPMIMLGDPNKTRALFPFVKDLKAWLKGINVAKGNMAERPDFVAQNE
ncbi:hypothetical protein V866_000372 [Kwoniella sp. B9012]